MSNYSETTIILTLAGLGTRFKREGYKVPKYLLPVKDGYKETKIIDLIINEIISIFSKEIRIIVVLNSKDYKISSQHFLYLSKKTNLDVRFIPIMPGQAYSVLAGFNFSEPDHGFTVMNGDTLISLDGIKNEMKSKMNMVNTFYSDSDDYSYVHLDKKGFVKKIVEKQVISTHASTGLYCFRSRDLFIEALNSLEENRIFEKPEIYLSEVIQQLINRGEFFKVIKTDMIDLGTPKKYEEYNQCIKK